MDKRKRKSPRTPLYDGDKPSTWIDFAKETGLLLNPKLQREALAEMTWERYRANGCKEEDFLRMPVEVMAHPPEWFWHLP